MNTYKAAYEDYYVMNVNQAIADVLDKCSAVLSDAAIEALKEYSK